MDKQHQVIPHLSLPLPSLLSQFSLLILSLACSLFFTFLSFFFSHFSQLELGTKEKNYQRDLETLRKDGDTVTKEVGSLLSILHWAIASLRSPSFTYAHTHNHTHTYTALSLVSNVCSKMEANHTNELKKLRKEYEEAEVIGKTF